MDQGEVRTALAFPVCSRVASHCSLRGRRGQRQLPYDGQLERHSCCRDILVRGREGGKRGREEGRKGEREGGREEGREGGREGGR